jgi:ribosomal protein S27AE
MEDGKILRWQRIVTKIERSDRSEEKRMSNKPCPECGRPMWEIVMTDFGSRWQCEHCRLTVFSSGGIQRWSRAK